LVLIDIGNTNFHIWENGRVYNLKKIRKFNDEIYYISVNEKKEKKLLELNPHAKKLTPKLNTVYKGLGVDRAMACLAVEDGVVVDAGSAITIDKIDKTKHLGGVILPGIWAMKEAYAKISPKLDCEIVNIDLNKLPKNTSEAVSYGIISSIVSTVENLRGDKKVYLTGGDGEFLNRFINGIYVKDLVFKGMLKSLKDKK